MQNVGESHLFSHVARLTVFIQSNCESETPMTLIHRKDDGQKMNGV